MKLKLKYLMVVAVTILILFSSCNDFLHVNLAGKITTTDYWKKESDVEAVVATCYRAMVEDDYMYRLLVYSEFRSDNVTLGYQNTDELKKISEANILPTNGYVDWSCFYKVINDCNVVLYYAPKVIDPNFTQSKLNAKLAEVLALRALNYFYLVRSFGQVPYITEASLTEDQEYNVAKSSEDVILDNLEKDLIKAESWALTSYGSVDSNKGRITKNAIRALLADIYLWRNKYDECITYCDKIMNDNTLKMILPDDEPFYTIFGKKNSSESIFELQFNIWDNTFNNPVRKFYGEKSNPDGYFKVPIYIWGTKDKNEVFKLPITDVRRKDYIADASSTTICNIYKYSGLNRTILSDGMVSKYDNYRDFNISPSNWIIYRLTDVMLMKAEALVQKNDFVPALKIVNITYMRSHPTLAETDSLKASDYISKTEMEELVLVERQREFLFEGKRWYDLMRIARRDGKTNRLVAKVLRKYSDNQVDVGSKMKDMNALYLPIYYKELNANKNLKQNPFYDNEFQ